jgi:hypothetical protein
MTKTFGNGSNQTVPIFFDAEIEMRAPGDTNTLLNIDFLTSEMIEQALRER